MSKLIFSFIVLFLFNNCSFNENSRIWKDKKDNQSINKNVKGIILSGGPCSVNETDSPSVDLSFLPKNIPISGLCYGAQLIAKIYGGEVVRSKNREYGRAKLNFISDTSVLMDGLEQNSQVWMSHGDTIFKLPSNSKRIASTADVENAAFKFNNENTFGIQFHPEVYHSIDGKKILFNFF